MSGSYQLRRFLRTVALPPSVAPFTWNGTWLPAEAASLLSADRVGPPSPDALARLASTYGLPEHPSVRHLQVVDVSEYLPNDILAKSDRASMAHGVEVRSPFLDRSLAEFALRLPASLKVSRSGRTKRILREIARRTCGSDIALAPKQGLSIPVHAWLRGSGRHIVEDLLSRRSVAAMPALDPVAVSSVVDTHMSGRRSFGFELWGLAVLMACADIRSATVALPAGAPHARSKSRRARPGAKQRRSIGDARSPVVARAEVLWSGWEHGSRGRLSWPYPA